MIVWSIWFIKCLVVISGFHKHTDTDIQIVQAVNFNVLFRTVRQLRSRLIHEEQLSLMMTIIPNLSLA